MSYPDIVKAELDAAIAQAAGDLGEYVANVATDFTRHRKLTPEIVIKLLLSMEGGSLKKELRDSGVDVTASAFVQQRAKLPPRIFSDILRYFNDAHKTYRGYRILAVDGTAVNMARNPDSDSFVYNTSTPQGYNQLHLNPLYDICSKTFEDCVIQPQPSADEIGALLTMLYRNRFNEKTLIIADRGFEAYNVLAHFLERNVDFLIRVKQDRTAMREVGKLPMQDLDVDVSFTITTTQTNEDKKNGYIFLQTPSAKSKIGAKTRNGRWGFSSPYNMGFRVVRFKLRTGEYETIATSLPSTFSPDDIKELYHWRWGIETAFRELKYSMGLTNLHGKKDDFVKQEIYSAQIMYNFCTRIVGQVVIEQKQENVYEYKVNQTMAIHLCKEFYRDPHGDGEKLMQDIAKYTEPIRPGRQDARNIRAKGFVGFIYRVAA